MKYVFVIICLALCGCMSDKQWEDTGKMHAVYMGQQRQFKPIELVGENMTITVTGVNRLTTEAPLNPLTTIPQYPDFAKDVLDGTKTIAGYTALGYIGGKAVDGLSVKDTVATTP